MRGGASGSGMSDEAEWRAGLKAPTGFRIQQFSLVRRGEMLVQPIRRLWKDDTVVASVERQGWHRNDLRRYLPAGEFVAGDAPAVWPSSAAASCTGSGAASVAAKWAARSL